MSVSLVLEGGGMRGVYTAGVLDVFNENNIIFPVTYGISAGACNALSYISGQKGRNKVILQEGAFSALISFSETSPKRFCRLIMIRFFQTICSFMWERPTAAPESPFFSGRRIWTGALRPL